MRYHLSLFILYPKKRLSVALNQRGDDVISGGKDLPGKGQGYDHVPSCHNKVKFAFILMLLNYYLCYYVHKVMNVIPGISCWKSSEDLNPCIFH